MLLAALILAAGCGAPSEPAPPAGLIAVPIGAGRAFVPAARAPRSCSRGPVAGRYRAHVELFARRRAIVVPAGIGLPSPPASRATGTACRATLRTLDPSGVVDFDRAGLHLHDLFAVWDEPFGPRRLLSFDGPVHVHVGGVPASADPPLRDGAEIVVESGGYVIPHRGFLFPPRR